MVEGNFTTVSGMGEGSSPHSLAARIALFGSAIAKPATECLLKYDWPGNIRELRNALEQAIILGDGKRITRSDLPPHIGKTGRGKMVFVTKPLSEVEKQYILRVLEETEGNKARAATILGISRETLYQKLKQYQAE